VSRLIDALAEAAPQRGRIGLTMGPETHLRMPLADHARVAAGLAPRRFTDATGVVRRVREVTSQAEIDRIGAACGVADRAFARVPEFAEAGRSLTQVCRAFRIALLEAGADWVAYLAGGAGPDGYADVIAPADDRVLGAGDVLMLDTGAVRDGHYCDIDSNFAIGRAGDAPRPTHAALHAATEDTLRAIRPGLRVCEVHRGLATALRERGATPGGGRMGHGPGLALTEWPSFTARDDTLLREGMVLTLEPAAEVVPGRILVHEETIVLRAGGAELLSARAPAELPVIRP